MKTFNHLFKIKKGKNQKNMKILMLKIKTPSKYFR